MKTTHKLSLTTAIVAVVLSAQVYAGSSANIGVASNYIWRGETQTNDAAAVSGGLDFETGTGLYVGTWVSNVDFSGGDSGQYEMDLYGGYGGKAGTLDYDVSLTHFLYPIGNDDSFTELGLSLGSGPITGAVAYTVASEDDTGAEYSTGDLYFSLSGSGEIKPGLSLGATVGHYDFDDNAGEDYSHVQVSLGKDDFTFALDKNDTDAGDDLRATASWSKSFDL